MQTVIIGMLGGISEDRLPAAEIHPRESESSYFAFLSSGAAILQKTALEATEFRSRRQECVGYNSRVEESATVFSYPCTGTIISTGAIPVSPANTPTIINSGTTAKV